MRSLQDQKYLLGQPPSTGKGSDRKKKKDQYLQNAVTLKGSLIKPHRLIIVSSAHDRVPSFANYNSTYHHLVDAAANILMACSISKNFEVISNLIGIDRPDLLMSGPKKSISPGTINVPRASIRIAFDDSGKLFLRRKNGKGNSLLLNAMTKP